MAVLSLGAAQATGLEVSPIYGLQVLGGQNFYSGQRNSLSANFTGIVAPAMKFNDKWALLPSYHSVYSGTQQVLDVVGAGTLFQSQWDNRLGMRAVYTPDGSQWRFKPSLSAKSEFLQQSKDEQLGSGLFDYLMFGAGFDAEYVYRDPFSVKLGVNYFQTHFRNYTTLESRIATQFQGQSLARELVGDHILDTKNFLFTASIEAPLAERLIIEGFSSFMYGRFPQQRLVAPSGDLSSPLREDVTTSLGASFKMPAELNSDLRLLGTLDFTGAYTSSNQNSFDATQTRFIPYYYNFGQVSVAPGVRFVLGPVKQATVVGLSATYWYRRYPYRNTQDPGSGAYQDGTSTHMHNWMLNATATYPMAPHFSLVFNVQHGRAQSNQSFQQFYRYNYTTTNYLFGFSYDY